MLLLIFISVLSDQDERAKPANPQTKLSAVLHGAFTMLLACRVTVFCIERPRVFVRPYIDQSHLSNRLPVRPVSTLSRPVYSWRLCSVFTDYMTPIWRLHSMQDRVSSAPYGLPYWQGVWEFASSLAAVTCHKHIEIIRLILSF
jgi:hypothetical protein